ncbi:shikimate kinase [Kroppenstedtia pulmonis]|uniref:Shikimate kinase n=1 Tax=Kroppenstedtia pulmonis TaxID=1380685 RepID=A0A7D3Y0X6_9BACL|nr:shikimate kinase [Kroppenstedtia pulmonis]QKG84840.1 shikimate kinase [Kroppenstedtia pulmonis]
MNRHIILIGMMGTGKSTIGGYLGKKTHQKVTDTDQRVEQTLGVEIPHIFCSQGENYFRDWETRILKEVLQESPHIITTGGGVVLRSENVDWMRKKGWIVALDASVEELCRRLQGDESRPLLQGDLKERITRLKRERRASYDFADLKLDTTGETPEETGERILKVWRSQTSVGL